MDQGILPGILDSKPRVESLDKYVWYWKVDHQEILVTTMGKHKKLAREELVKAICESHRTTKESLRGLFYTLKKERKIKLQKVEKLS